MSNANKQTNTPSLSDHHHHHEKDICSICQNEVKDNDKAIECSKCQTWIHIKCNNITTKQYKHFHFQDNPEEIFECKNCTKCKVCIRTVAANHHAIECNICLRWVHIKCNKLRKITILFRQMNTMY